MVCGESLISLEDLDAVAAERDAAASKTKEYISAPKHLLKPYQVFSIIANRMIGKLDSVANPFPNSFQLVDYLMK